MKKEDGFLFLIFLPTIVCVVGISSVNYKLEACLEAISTIQKEKVIVFHTVTSSDDSTIGTEEITSLTIESNFFDMSVAVIAKFKIKPEIMKDIQTSVVKYAKHFDLSIPLVYAIMEQESGFNPKCYTDSGSSPCYGLMQINYSVWSKELQMPDPSYLYDINNNIKSGCYIFRKYLDYEGGDIQKALVRYYGVSNYAFKYAGKVLRILKRYESIQGSKQ